VSTYQAVSGAGIAALDQFLDDSKKGYAEPERLGLKLDVAQYAGNTVPHNGKTDEGGFSAEERKLMFESRKILTLPQLDISAQCCRVGVAVGHYENAWLTFDKPATLEGVAAALSKAAFVKYYPGASGDGLTALASVHHRDVALVGRARLDGRGALCLTVVGDNLRLGAATNAIRIASRWFKSADAALQVAA
jgi:aspartate-semialdehyde dehydrogenase